MIKKKRSYRRSRSYGAQSVPTYTILAGLFGTTVQDIKRAFFNLDPSSLPELFAEYEETYGASAANYARRTFPNWKSGRVDLSGKTMERLIELVPPYLEPEERYALLVKVLKVHRSVAGHQVRINLYEPAQGFQELNTLLGNLRHTDTLAYLPDKVMRAARWLYNNDITAARSMLAQADRAENEIVRARAIEELEQLKQLISSGTVDEATYQVTLPSGSLTVETYTPFFHLKTFLPKSIARFI